MAKAPAVIAALLVFMAGRGLSNRVAKGFEATLNKSPQADASLSRFFASVVRYVLLLITIIIVLRLLGIDTSGLSGMILGMGAALAFILKDALSDVAAGVMLMLFRPYNVGDEVEIGGKKGVVQAIDLLATRMKTRDNIAIIVPNAKAWGGVICNHNAMGARRLDKVFGISYDADIDKAIDVLTQTAAQDARVYSDPAPWAKVVNLGESSVDIELRIWCDYNDHRAIKMDISQPVKQAFDKAGIGIPYPHEVKIKQKIKNSKGRNRISRLAKLRNAK